ncbi:MAG: murein biosynthesis integral membrane protein MurJ [Burkholderiales bacterium]|nr:murein biosynthesis integral membrane protein MurJ [Phycisphaerae bacterium]
MPQDTSTSSHSFLRHARLIGALTLLSRVLGLVRDMVAGHFLGTKMIASAFTFAFSIPNLFRKLLGEGALSQAFIPLYAQAIRRGASENGEPPDRFAAGSLKLLGMILIAITIVGEIILGTLIVANLHTSNVRWLLMLQFTAIMLPYVMLVCGGAFLSAILQVHKRFGAPAFAPVLLNVLHIAVVAGGAWYLGLQGRQELTPHVIDLQTRLAFMLAVAVVIAGVLQVLVLLPALRQIGFKFQFSTARAFSPDTRRMLRLTIPVAIGAAVLQTSVLLDKGISYVLMQGVDRNDNLIREFTLLGQTIRYPMEIGATRRLEIAQLMYQFPLGIFAIALATAMFPSLSAGAMDEHRAAFKRITRRGIEATLWEGLPASIGLALVADPAVRLLFQHGQITAADATLIIHSTRYYAAGIWAYSLLQVVNRAYYALHDTRTPLIASVLNIVVNLAVELPLIWYMGEAGMAVGTLVSFSLQAILMIWLLGRRVGGLELRSSVAPILKMLLASAIMLIICLAIKHSRIYPQGDSRQVWAVQLALLTVIGAGVYAALCKLMKVRSTEAGDAV